MFQYHTNLLLLLLQRAFDFTYPYSNWKKKLTIYSIKNLRVIRTRRASGWCEPEREDSEAKFELRSGEKRSYGGGCGCGHTFHHVKEENWAGLETRSIREHPHFLLDGLEY